MLILGIVLTIPFFANAETIKSATEYDYPPFSVKSEDGQAGGFSVELLRASLLKVGLDVDFYIDSWAKIKDDLNVGKIQVLPLVGRTPERESIYDFTVPYISLYGAIFIRTNEDNIKNLADLKNKEVLVMKGDNAEEYVRRKQISEKIITVESYEEAFKLLSLGKYDAIISQQIVGRQVLEKEKINNVILLSRINEYKQDFTFAVKEGGADLLAKLNNGLSQVITDGTYDRIYKKWFVQEVSENNLINANQGVEELSMKLSALQVASQIDSYLKKNPKLTIKDLQNDPAFREIAIQKVGETGYSVLMDSSNGIYYLHPQKKIINTSVNAIKYDFPELWDILSKSIGEVCHESSGYYKWIESDGMVTDKYLYSVCINQKTADGKKLFVSVTNYLDIQAGRKYLSEYGVRQNFTYAKESIKQKAEDVAKQIEIYLTAHPEKNISDLQADEYFQKIAVQQVGKTGYTAVTENETLINRFHKNPQIINTDLNLLSEKLPGFWNIISKIKEGRAVEGVYDWEEPDGTVRQKYMYIEVVNALPADKIAINVAATTYIDDYLNGLIDGKQSVVIETADSDSGEKFINATYWAVGIVVLILLFFLLLNGIGIVKIGQNMMFSFFGTIVLIVILLFLVNIFLIKDGLVKVEEENFNQQNIHISDLEADQIKSLFNSLYDELAFLENASQKFTAEGEELHALLVSSYERKKAYVYAAYRIDKNGTIVNMYPFDNNSFGQNISEQEHMQKIKKTLLPVASNIFSAVEGFNGITIHFPVILNGEYDGTVAFLIDIDSLVNLADFEKEVRDNQKIYLVDGNLTIIKTNDKEQANKKITEIDKYNSQKSTFEAMNLLGQPAQKEIKVYDKIEIVSYYPFSILDNQWSVYVVSDKEAISANTKNSFSRIWIFSLILLILLVTVVFIFNVLITKSLRKEINRTTGEIKKNNKLMIDQLAKEEKINKEKEILLEEQKNSRKQLESKNKEIENVLSGIQHDKQDLEKQRMAILNILEDVNRSGEDLKHINESLEKKKTELEALRSLGIELTSVLDLEEAIKIFCIYLAEVIDFDVATYMIVNIEDEGGLIYMAYLNQEVSEKYLNSAQAEMLKYLSSQSDSVIKRSVNVIRNIKPHFFGKKLNNNNDFNLNQKIIYPLMIGSNMLGVIQLTSRKDKDISGGNKEFIEAMLSNFSLSISRLQTIVRSQNSRTGSLIESLSDGVIMFNSEKNIVLMNPRASKYTGIPIASPSIDDVYNLFVEYDIANMINKSLFSGETSHLEEIALEKSYYELFIIPVKDVYGKIVGGAIIFHDITSLKKIDKMKTEFVSVASHQLRTPLTAIKLFTDMLIREEVGKLNVEQAEYLSNVHESTERMVRLVNDLLNVTRIESGRLRINPELISIREFVEGIIAEAKPLAKEKNTKIVSSYDQTLPKVPLDQNLMRQVIQNLLVNAIRYAHEKNGTVSIDIHKTDEEFFMITVKDDGIGIPQDVQDRIFEKFFRANNAIKSVTEGTGLGLYVSKMIVESSGGKIWFESIDNAGTTFFVKLPVLGMKEQKGERGLAIS